MNTGVAELAVIVPTFNERENITPLLERLGSVLADLHWEVIFVDDDSPDGTADEIRKAALADQRVRCIRRVGRRGLASACIEGMASSLAEYFLVMDADLQHDEKIIPKLLAAVRDEGYDVAVGSRYAAGGGVAEGWCVGRSRRSRDHAYHIQGGLSLTKADIVDTIATATGLTKVETEAVVDGFISTVINAMKEGKNIEIRGFGSFKVKKRKGRIARNPRTGEQVMVEEHWVPLFKVSKEVKALVNENLKRAV